MLINYLLGIDLGTSSIKAALFEAATLQMIGSAGHEYPVQHPFPGYAEQDPAAWWAGAVQAVRAVMEQARGGQVLGIGLAGQMHGLVCLDKNNKALCPAIIWADSRSAAEVAELAAFQVDCPALLPGPPGAGFAAASALWLSRHRPQILSQTQTILSPKDYLRLRLSGRAATDPSDASGTWLFDLATSSWAPQVVARCGLRMEQMPPVLASTAVSGYLTPAAAQELGLPAGIPVINGSADTPAQALAHNCIDPGSVLVSVSSGGWLFQPRLSAQPDPAGRLHQYRHNVPGRWFDEPSILSGGLSLRWLRDLLGLSDRPDAFSTLSSLAAAVAPGSDGLLFLPYLAGERSPHMDAQAAGLFLGLRLHHQPGHLARAVMEGVGFALKACLNLVDTGEAQITLTGGVTQSAVWPQILADIWERPLTIALEELPRACLGAAILAGVGIGLYQDVQEATAVRSEPSTTIQPNQNPLYRERFAQFQRLYPLLKEEMHHLSSVPL